MDNFSIEASLPSRYKRYLHMYLYKLGLARYSPNATRLTTYPTVNNNFQKSQLYSISTKCLPAATWYRALA